MHRKLPVLQFLVAGVLCGTAMNAPSQTPSNAKVPQTDSSYIAPDGTAHVTRIVPVPRTISSQAQQVLSRPASDKPAPQSLAQRRAGTDTWQLGAGKAFRALYPVDIQESALAGVPVRVITPPGLPLARSGRVLINLHGGGFNSDSGSYSESIPVSALSGIPVVAVLYRLAPEHKFPAAVDDAVAVYRELLKTHKPQQIGVFGTSAGAVLTAEVAVALRKNNLPLPAALGVFSGMGDFSLNGDSTAMYALNGLSGYLAPPQPPAAGHGEYTGATDLRDPILSPVYADLHGMPPTLFITSGRDLLLSGTTILHRAFLRAGADARLIVFEALPHAFWNDPKLPETKEANQFMAQFFDRQVSH